MSVYVDDFPLSSRSNHRVIMIADTTAELMEVADLIPIPRWDIQGAASPNEHFLICANQRQLAIANGAIPINSHALASKIAKRRNQWQGHLRRNAYARRLAPSQ